MDFSKTIEEDAIKYNVISDIHTDDFIFQFILINSETKELAIKYYFNDGCSSANKLKLILNNICNIDLNENFRLLEFASGYGMVTRHYKNVMPLASITSCDIHPQAVQFIKEKIGVEALLSKSNPDLLHFENNFDIVFALSFFSHIPKTSFRKWLSTLTKAVKPGGFLVFTTHGRITKKKYLNNYEFDEDGYFFVKASEQKDLDLEEYGTTCTLPRFVLSQIFFLPQVTLKYFNEAYWWHQDVYIIQIN